MSENDVIRILGEPDKVIIDAEEIKKYLRAIGIEKAEEVSNGLTKRLIYYHGVDYVGSYLIDKRGRVYFKEVGGT